MSRTYQNTTRESYVSRSGFMGDINPVFNSVSPSQLREITRNDKEYEPYMGSNYWMPFPPATRQKSWISVVLNLNNYLDKPIGIAKKGTLFFTTSLKQIDIKDSTNNVVVNQLSEEFKHTLQQSTSGFVRDLRHTDFQDGMENDVILKVESYIEKNKYVTCSWLSDIFLNNKDDMDIIAGLLRVIGMVTTAEDEGLLLPMVIAGLSNVNPKTQEAALMVIEQWRTINCLDALKSTKIFSSPWLNAYAKQIEIELNEELCDVVANG